MPSRIYLSRFRARDFRAFGNVDIRIPGEPGLVLLEGPNGLGKTSWMEALEWTLSGRVHRWEKLDADHAIKTEQQIRRRNAPPGEPSVLDLEFGEHRATWKEGTAPAAATWLCDDPDRWSLRSDNLNGFLRATHILPQSSSLRLLHLDAEERWKQVLRVASGFSDIDDLSTALQGSKAPLSAELKARATRVAEAKRALVDWSTRVAAVVSKRERVRAIADLKPPSYVHAMLADEGAPGFPDTQEGARELSVWLNNRLGSHRSERDRLAGRRASLTTLADVPARWQAAGAAVADSLAAVRTCEADEERLRDALVKRVAEEELQGSRVAAASAAQEAERRRLDDLVLLAESLAGLPEARDTLATADRLACAAKEALSQAVERRVRVSALVEQRRAYDARVEAHQRRVIAKDAAEVAWTRVRKLMQQRELLDRATEPLNADLAGTLEALEAAHASLAERTVETARARQLADQVRAAAGEVQGLVAALARHVQDHSDRCPLCLADYPELGELRERVEKAQQEQNPAVAQVERALGDAVAREADAVTMAKHATEAHERSEQKYKANQAELSALDREIAEARSRMPGIGQGREDEDLSALRNALEAERVEVAGLPGATTEATWVLAVQLEQAVEVVRTAEGRHALAQASAAQAATELAQLEARVASIRHKLALAEGDDVDAQVATARSNVAEAIESVRLAKEWHATAQTVREQAQATLSRVNEKAIFARAARDQQLEEQEKLARIWAGHELAGLPDGHELNAAERESDERIGGLEMRITVLVAAAEGLGRWLDNTANDAESRDLDATAEGTGPAAWEARTQRLADAVNAADAAHTRAQSVRNDIERMAGKALAARATMRSQLESRISPVLAPMLRSMIVDRMIADAAIALGEQRRKTTVTATVGTEATDLLAVASEGQLSGVNLAVQLSMALAFRWSRWPAVLLDDPAQYSDVVHSTNLVETLRVLALHHGFQVFLATHERDFALYAERKFRNDGLAATRVMFRQPSDPTLGVVPRLAAK